MPRIPLVFALPAMAVLVGCVSYQPQHLTADATQAALDNRSLNDAGLQQFLSQHRALPDGDWDLARLTLAAFYFSPALDVARGRLAEAEAGIDTATARPNPDASFTPGYNQDAIGVTPWSFGYALTVPLEIGGKRRIRTAEAQQRAEEARLDLAQAAWRTRSAVRRSLVDLHTAEALARIWRSQQPLLADAARLVDAQVEAGDTSQLLAAQTRVALHRAELAARESDRAAVVARSHLAEAIGVPLAALETVRISYRGLADAPPAVDALEARRWAAQNRADLLAALAAYSAAQFALQGEIARQYPDLSFGPGYNLDQGEGKWTLALGFTLPVFHRNQGPIAAAQARRETAAAHFLAVQNRVLAEVDRALSGYATAVEDLATVEALRASLERQARLVEAQQQAGETSRLDLARAQIELADTARMALAAQVRTEQALGAIEDAVQRPLTWPESTWRTPPRLSAN